MNQSNTIETLKLFVQTVIDETKNDNIVWSVDTEYIANTDPFVSPIAFSAKYKDTEMYLQRNEKEYRFVVQFNKHTPYMIVSDYKNEEIIVSTARLFNLVYDKVPKATDYMLDFINSFKSKKKEI